jgi:phosphoserine/homoserine phosphotransferase
MKGCGARCAFDECLPNSDHFPVNATKGKVRYSNYRLSAKLRIARIKSGCTARIVHVRGTSTPVYCLRHKAERKKMEIACLDLEGVLVPEIWIGFAEKTGIDDLRATTREVPDYDELMQQRLRILNEHGLGLPDIQEVIATMAPLPGAQDFVKWLKSNFQLIILSDTFYEFSYPLMRQLDFPTLFCHKLVCDDSGKIVDYKLRQPDPKRASVQALHGLNFRGIASGDSYNDVSMLEEADAGILFRAPDRVIEEFPQYPAVTDYADLRREFCKASLRDIS